MRKVNFYLLKSADLEQRNLFICRLIEKTYHLGFKSYVYCTDEEQTRKLDNLLWTFKDTSFIPHGINSSCNENEPPIILGTQEPSADFSGLLINLSANAYIDNLQIKRIAEIILLEEPFRSEGRKKYRLYQENNFTCVTNEI